MSEFEKDDMMQYLSEEDKKRFFPESSSDTSGNNDQQNEPQPVVEAKQESAVTKGLNWLEARTLGSLEAIGLTPSSFTNLSLSIYKNVDRIMNASSEDVVLVSGLLIIMEAVKSINIKGVG